MTTRRKYWLHFMTPKQPTVQARAQVEAQTALNFGLALVGLRTQELLELCTDLVSGRKVPDVCGQQAGPPSTLDVGVVLALQGLHDLRHLVGAGDLLRDLAPVETGRGHEFLRWDVEPRYSHEALEPHDGSVGELSLGQVVGHVDREPERVVTGLAQPQLEQGAGAARHLQGTEEGVVLTDQLSLIHI